MFLEKAHKPNNPFYKYIIGFIVIAVAFMIGQAPLTFYVIHLAESANIPMPTTELGMAEMMNSSIFLLLVLLSFTAVFLVFPVLVRGIHKMSFKDIITGRSHIDYKKMFFGFSVWGGLMLVSFVIDLLLFPKDYVFQFDLEKFAILAIVAVIFIPIQSATEELIFRGYLMQGFGLLFQNKFFPLIITSVLFGLVHGMNPEVDKMGDMILIFYIGTGLFLGILTLMDDGAELAIGFHIANNLLTVLLVTTDWGALQSDAVFKDISEPEMLYSIFLPLFVAYPILLVIFARKYQWSNWKNKLTGNINYYTIDDEKNNIP